MCCQPWCAALCGSLPACSLVVSTGATRRRACARESQCWWQHQAASWTTCRWGAGRGGRGGEEGLPGCCCSLLHGQTEPYACPGCRCLIEGRAAVFSIQPLCMEGLEQRELGSCTSHCSMHQQLGNRVVGEIPAAATTGVAGCMACLWCLLLVGAVGHVEHASLPHRICP